MKLWLKLAGLLTLALCLGYCANVTATHQMELGYGYPPTPVILQIQHDWERSHSTTQRSLVEDADDTSTKPARDVAHPKSKPFRALASSR